MVIWKWSFVTSVFCSIPFSLECSNLSHFSLVWYSFQPSSNEAIFYHTTNESCGTLSYFQNEMMMLTCITNSVHYFDKWMNLQKNVLHTNIMFLLDSSGAKVFNFWEKNGGGGSEWTFKSVLTVNQILICSLLLHSTGHGNCCWVLYNILDSG